MLSLKGCSETRVACSRPSLGNARGKGREVRVSLAKRLEASVTAFNISAGGNRSVSVTVSVHGYRIRIKVSEPVEVCPARALVRPCTCIRPGVLVRHRSPVEPVGGVDAGACAERLGAPPGSRGVSGRRRQRDGSQACT